MANLTLIEGGREAESVADVAKGSAEAAKQTGDEEISDIQALLRPAMMGGLGNLSVNRGTLANDTPDEQEIEKYPELVLFLKQIEAENPGYKNIANIYAKMRVAIRAAAIEKGLWHGADDELPSEDYRPLPISLDRLVKRLQAPELEVLLDRVSNPDLPVEQRDLEDDYLFAIVARNLLVMDNRFLYFGFDDDFVNSICDHLVENFKDGKKDVRSLMLAKLGDKYGELIKTQARLRWSKSVKNDGSY